LCVTVDFDSLEDGSVTIRHRDSTEQVRVSIADLESEISRLLGF
jgi:glycyl-tRNA synthetase